MYQVSEKLKASRHCLHRWSKYQFGSVRNSIAKKTRQLQMEEDAIPSVQNVPLIKQLRQELYI
jgi:hypothetical protein